METIQSRIPVFVILVTLIVISGYGQPLKEYKNPHEAGFDTQKLGEIKETFQSSEAAALLVLFRENVILSIGETTRKFRCASMRKSIMNAMIGIAVGDGDINLKSTLAELGIDDNPKLTEEERTATVEDLLSARSGIYHMASYMPRSMEKNMPERGSHKPGTFWHYNNWDFNTLVTIYNQQTSKDFFNEFNSKIAQPIGMEDFSLEDTFYRYEKDKSIHPAYLFRMSARDLGRFGQLYLNNGIWNGNQIIAKEWIDQSTKPHSTHLGLLNHKGDYGYLWWVGDSLFNQKMYFASGSGGQRIAVFPEEELVIVHLVDTYDNNDVDDEEIFNLFRSIIDSKTASANANSKLIPYSPTQIERPKFVEVEKSILEKYKGKYEHGFLGELTISLENGQMFLTTGIGKFKIYPTGKNTFYPENIQTPLEFVKADDTSNLNIAKSLFKENRKLDKVIFYY